MKNIINYILILMVLFSTNNNIVKAQEPEILNWDDIELALKPLEEVQLEPPKLSAGNNGEKQVLLFKGSTVPFKGVLLNPEAIAFITTEYEASFLRAQASLNKQRASDMNRLRLEVGKLSLQLETEKKQSKIQIKNLKAEISNLEDIHQDYLNQINKNKRQDKIKKTLLIVGSGLVGIASGFLLNHFI